MGRYWRIRLRHGDGNDYSQRAWEKNEVGVWYGAWSESELADAENTFDTTSEIAEFLSNVPEQVSLEWKVTPSYVNTVKRFRQINEEDLVVLYLSLSQNIGLARVKGGIDSYSDHSLNLCGERFKYRRIVDKKKFPISELPDAYRLLPNQGRGNVHEFNVMYGHVQLLADHENAAALNQAFRDRPFDELLDLLGASAWESFAFAYLILETEFVPTGLSTGRTMPVVDIVGRRRSDGSRIVAQCKKNSYARDIEPEFLILSESLGPNDSAYYFAYGGCVGEVPKTIRVIDRTSALHWAETDNGKQYCRLILRD